MQSAELDINASFRLLILDDSVDEASLSEHELRLSGLEFESRVVSDRVAFVAALAEFVPDVILSENRIVDFEGLAAYQAAIKSGFDGAFILVPASLSGADMTDALRQGVTHCVGKRHLYRLGLVVRCALSERRVNLSYRQSEERYQLLLENLPVMAYRAALTPDRELYWVSRKAAGIIGWNPWMEAHENLLRLTDFVHPSMREAISKQVRVCIDERSEFDQEYLIQTADGQELWVHDRMSVFSGGSRDDGYLIGFAEDITERKLNQARLAQMSTLHRAMRAVSRVMAHADRCDALYAGVCNALVQEGGYKGAWIVYGKNQSYQALAAAGVGDQVELLALPGEELRHCEDCSVRGFLNGHRSICRKSVRDCPHAHRGLAEHGCHDLITIPFGDSIHGDGMVVVVTRAGNIELGDEEMVLLQQMADDLQHGMTHLYERRDREVLLRGLETQNHELAEARDVARESEQAKMRFLAAMSHEIRTPLNGIIGMTQLLLGTPMSKPQRDDFNSIRRASNHLLGVVNEVLDFSRLDSGRVVLEKTVFDPAEILRQIATSFNPIVHGKPQVSISVNIGEGIPMLVLGDAYRFHVVLYNLVGNAFKFTEHGGITLTLQTSPGAGDPYFLEVWVRDTGPGIPEQDQNRVFDPFEQAEGGRGRSHGGTGLGLPISRYLARLMGGDIRLESVLGMGCTFIASMHFEPVPGGAVADVVADVKSMVNLPPGLRVLVAEDDLLNQKVTSRYLAKLGVDVVIANDGKEAVNQQREQCFDVILMDLHMPVMDGVDAAYAIRQLEGVVAEVPIIAFTADAMSETEVLQDGLMQGYLLKPVTVFKISQAIRAALYIAPEIG